MDRVLQDQLDNYGFSQCIVVHKHIAAFSASKPDLASIDSHFLPAPVAPGWLSRATMWDSADAPPVFHYPRLGLSLGYADHDGASALEAHPEVEAVYPGRAIEIVQPVRVAAATLRQRYTWGLRILRIPRLWAQGLTGKVAPAGGAAGLRDRQRGGGDQPIAGQLRGSAFGRRDRST